MFDFGYKKHNYIYNNLVELSRNIFFYKDLKINDKLENRVIIIFTHLCIILRSLKRSEKYKKISQEIYDNIFLNIENNIREMGHGDVTVNKKMKLFNQIFHDILMKLFNNKKDSDDIDVKIVVKHLNLAGKSDHITEKLLVYFNKYRDFCFDIIDKSMLKDIIKFRI